MFIFDYHGPLSDDIYLIIPTGCEVLKDIDDVPAQYSGDLQLRCGLTDENDIGSSLAFPTK